MWVSEEEISDCRDIELEVSLESFSGIFVKKFGISQESGLSKKSDILIKSEFDESFDERTMCFLFFEFRVLTRSIQSGQAEWSTAEWSTAE